MDLASVIGAVSGIILLISAILTNASLSNFFDVASILIVLGGGLAATLIAFGMKDVLNTAKVLKKVFLHQEPDLFNLIKEFVEYANIIRKEGPQKLEKMPTESRFVKKALQLIADGASEENILKTLELEKEATMQRHATGKDIMETLGDFFPAFGMIGTLIGLVVMLLNLSDPSTIGPAMAVALITTFYGAVLANLFAIPMAKKLELRSAHEMIEKDLIIQGTVSLRKAENPRVIEDKLTGYLHPSAKEA